jgi:hypothetical protein
VFLEGVDLFLCPLGPLLLFSFFFNYAATTEIYTSIALVAEPNPAQALRAFAFLPIYVLWRIGNAARAVRLLRNGPWIRTQRHQPGGA